MRALQSGLFLKFCLALSFGTHSSVSSLSLTLCVGFFALNEPPPLSGRRGLAEEMNLIVQSCPGSWSCLTAS